jgi:hypothetical protein
MTEDSKLDEPFEIDPIYMFFAGESEFVGDKKEWKNVPLPTVREDDYSPKGSVGYNPQPNKEVGLLYPEVKRINLKDNTVGVFESLANEYEDFNVGDYIVNDNGKYGKITNIIKTNPDGTKFFDVAYTFGKTQNRSDHQIKKVSPYEVSEKEKQMIKANEYEIHGNIWVDGKLHKYSNSEVTHCGKPISPEMEGFGGTADVTLAKLNNDLCKKCFPYQNESLTNEGFLDDRTIDWTCQDCGKNLKSGELPREHEEQTGHLNYITRIGESKYNVRLGIPEDWQQNWGGLSYIKGTVDAVSEDEAIDKFRGLVGANSSRYAVQSVTKTSEALSKNVIDEIWNKMNESERIGVKFGLFPMWTNEYVEENTVDGHRELAVALMKKAEESLANEYEHGGKHTEIAKAIQRENPDIDEERAMKIANAQIHKYDLESYVPATEFKPELQGKKIRLKDGSIATVQAVGIFDDSVLTTDGRSIKKGDYEIIGESLANEGTDWSSWWNSKNESEQEQILLAAGVDPRHKGLSWLNLGQENQALIKKEFGYKDQIFESLANEVVEWKDVKGRVIDKGTHFETEDGQLIIWSSTDALRAQKYLTDKANYNADETIKPIVEREEIDYENTEFGSNKDGIIEEFKDVPESEDALKARPDDIKFEDLDESAIEVLRNYDIYDLPQKATEAITNMMEEDKNGRAEESELVTKIINRKLDGYSERQIVNELFIWDEIPHEEGLKLVRSIEVSADDKAAHTLFGKRVHQLNARELNELNALSGNQ